MDTKMDTMDPCEAGNVSLSMSSVLSLDNSPCQSMGTKLNSVAHCGRI